MNIGGTVNHNIDIADEDMAALKNIAWGIAAAFALYTAAGYLLKK